MFFLSFSISVSLTGVVPVFAANNPYLGCPDCNGTSNIQQIPSVAITVTTDKPSYNNGDEIMITGHVSQLNSNSAVNLRIFNPSQNLVSVGQLVPDSNGDFIKTLLTVGPLWTNAGTYTVEAQYGTGSQPVTTTFFFSGGTGTSTVTQVINATYPLQVGGQNYNILYVMKGGTVSSMNILAPQYTLEIILNANADGSITVTIPRTLMDAKSTNTDINFIITVNGQSITQFTEIMNPTVRVLSIPFHAGDTKIDIMGTQTGSSSTPHPNNPYLGCPDCNGTTNAPASTTTPTTATPAKIPNWVKAVFGLLCTRESIR